MISFWVKRLPDSSTLITSLADGGRRSRFELLCGSNSASAKTIPHFSSHRSQLLIGRLFIPFYWGNSPGRTQPRLWKLTRPGHRPGSKRLCTSLPPIRSSIRRCYPRATRATEGGAAGGGLGSAEEHLNKVVNPILREDGLLSIYHELFRMRA